MPYINLPDSLMRLHRDYDTRLQKLETGKRFTIPTMATDPTIYRVGDMWINTTSGLTKYVDKNGAIQTFGGSSSAGSPFGPRYMKTGYAYGSMSPASLITSSLPSNNTMYATPIYIPAAITATSLGIYVVTIAGTPAQGIRVGLYSNSSTDDYPNTLLVDGGRIETSATFGSAGWNLNTISTAITTPGLYWLVSCRQATTAPTTNCLQGLVTGDYAVPVLDVAAGNNTPAIAYQQTGITGALPGTFTATKSAFAGVVHQVVMGI